MDGWMDGWMDAAWTILTLSPTKKCLREFPGSPVVRTPHFHCGGPGKKILNLPIPEENFDDRR